VVFIIILRNSVKSLQNSLNELTISMKINSTVTSSAYSQARKKLRHSAFQELDEDIKNIFYQESNVKKFKGFRLIAFDGSKIILPHTSEVIKKFGSTKINNHTNQDLGSFTSGLFIAGVDVLNQICVSSTLTQGNSYEVDEVIPLFDQLNKDDLLIFDRGYASYKALAALIDKNKNFIVRIPKASFAESNKMFKKGGKWTKEVELIPRYTVKDEIEALNLPNKIKVRFVKVILSTGEVEVLATSLLDEEYTQNDFKKLYGLRWGVETFFSILKGRLELENFTGTSLESVLQDFWAAIFLSNIESIMASDLIPNGNAVNNNTPKGETKKTINKSVAFNVLKNMAFEIFANNDSIDIKLDKIFKLFLMKPNITKIDREVERKKITARRALNFNKRKRKRVF